MGRIIRRLMVALAGLLVAAIGGALSWWGFQLATLGGSLYYAAIGLLLVAAGVLIILQRRAGYWLFVLGVLVTVPWALWEAGLDRWGLMARLLAPAMLLLLLTPVAIAMRPARFERNRIGARTLFGFSVLQAVLLGFGWIAVRDAAPAADGDAAAVERVARADWPSYGGDWRGDHFSALAQVTPANAPRLQRAWSFRVGGLDDLGANSRFTATPLVIGRTMYLCDPRNVIVAIDATTGREQWRHDPRVTASKAFSIVCRGVSYHRSAEAGPCSERILEATLDARLIAVDARNGAPCPGFGKSGAVDLLRGVEPRFDGYYYVTSPPAIIGDLAVLGGYVIDNQRLDAARSVVRGYDVRDGSLRWTWDAGAPDGAARDPQALFSAGNPNAWAVFSADPELGMVYVPTGNSSPDFFGGLRTLAAERFGTSIVALDAASGAVRWSFQTVHHDLWDYDMPAQPALVDLPVDGQTVPALVATGKTGEIFLLDRRDGRPLSPVEERQVPRSGVAGERASPTQPFSPGLPSFAPPRVEERALWGATPIDMLLCRLRFRQLRYEGAYTPPSIAPWLFAPGTFGAINWGGVAIDRARGLMIVNSASMPFIGELVPRTVADKAGARPFGADSGRPARPAEGAPMPPMAMKGTPFGLRLTPFLSPIGFPCLAPPWGEIAAIDLKRRTLAWRRPFGTTKGFAPFGLALPVGIFNLGGAVTTAGGVTFIGAATDGYFRAIETATGRELWRAPLPAGGQATPVSYAAADGRQMIAIVAGGHGSLRTPRGDHIVAFALPRSQIRNHAP
jgi:membrane-bound PQQ-dependent dehydrogenase (glucose/quinate/shikimate family)